MTPERSTRPEIQGLRAIAVGLVVIFHVWPQWLTGGYVGVDVFFVISGFLITGSLARSAERDGRISLVDFYSRRARRLLPAATATLAFTIVGSLIFLPKGRWEETAIQIVASALYVENWALAWLAVDYLGAENAASPVQHFWSLSIEEQFYFVWPLLMIGTILAARRFGMALRPAFVLALALVFAASLAASLLITPYNPAQSYFFTHTRIWELALGGLLALTIDRFPLGMPTRIAFTAVGVAAIVFSAIVYSAETPFPGYAALLPTLGTVLIIMAGDIRAGRFTGLNERHLLWIGDRSYSIYLWHWPIIVFYTVGQESMGLMEGVGVIALTLVMSHYSYHGIEERYRHPRKRDDVRPLGLAFASIAACVGAAAALQYTATMGTTSYAAVSPGNAAYPGPAAFLSAAAVPEGLSLFPPLDQVKDDLPHYSAKLGCHQNQRDAEPITCVLGDPEGEKTVAIVGDSHAGHWVPALEEMARVKGWKLLPFTKSACTFGRTDVLDGARRPYTSCAEWRENVLEEMVRQGVEVMFTSQSRYRSVAIMKEAYRSIWSDVTARGIEIVVIADTPWMPFTPIDCLAVSPPSSCLAPRAKVVAPPQLTEAAQGMPNVRVVDLTDAMCDENDCHSVVGNVIVWRDRHHMTTAFSRMLAPYLAEKSGFGG